MMLLQGGGIGSAAGTAKDDRCADQEARKKQEYADSLQEAQPLTLVYRKNRETNPGIRRFARGPVLVG